MTGFDSKRQMAQAKPKAQSDLIKRLRDTASKGVSVWGDLQMAAAREIEILTARVLAAQQQAKMRLPKVGDRVICLEDESLGTVESLTAGGSPDITFDDGSRGTYLLREFAELFGYVAPPQRQWVGLTDEEWEPLYDKLAKYQEYGAFVSGWDNFARAIEAKLKEKNDH